MSKNVKDSAQAEQAAAPQKDNTAFKIVAIVLIVLFGFPLIMAIAALIFISANFDRISAWVDSHIDDWENYAYVQSEARSSAKNLYDAASGKDVKISHADCRHIKDALYGNGTDASRMLTNLCGDDEIKVAAEDNGKKDSIFFEKDGVCLELVFKKDFEYLHSYNYDSWSDGCNREMNTVKFDDSKE